MAGLGAMAKQHENTKQAFRRAAVDWPGPQPGIPENGDFSFDSVHVLFKTCLQGSAAFMGHCLEAHPLPVLSPVCLSVKS